MDKYYNLTKQTEELKMEFTIHDKIKYIGHNITALVSILQWSLSSKDAIEALQRIVQKANSYIKYLEEC